MDTSPALTASVLAWQASTLQLNFRSLRLGLSHASKSCHWALVFACISMGGSCCMNGTVLIDTGISQYWTTVPSRVEGQGDSEIWMTGLLWMWCLEETEIIYVVRDEDDFEQIFMPVRFLQLLLLRSRSLSILGGKSFGGLEGCFGCCWGFVLVYWILIAYFPVNALLWISFSQGLSKPQLLPSRSLKFQWKASTCSG